MNILKIIISFVLFALIVFMFFYVASNTIKKRASLAALLLVILTAALSFITIEKKHYIKAGGEEFKIVNISYYCPYCSYYISGLNTEYCSRCGHNLQEVKKRLNNF